MFVGSINQDVRAVITECAPRWRRRPVYVGASGNFTIERTLAAAGVPTIHSNDVSLYSCAIGAHLTGAPLTVTVTDPDSAYAWLTPFLAPGIPTIATLLLAMEYFKSAGRGETHHLRMARAYETQWPTLHAQTVDKVTKALTGLQLASFTPGDVVDFVTTAPDDAVVVAVPPSTDRLYEKLYERLDAVFTWDAPRYHPFDDARCTALTDAMRTKADWLLLRDKAIDDLQPWLIGRIQRRPDELFIYGGDGSAHVIGVSAQKTEAVPWSRLEGEVDAPLRLVRLTPGQLNTLRCQYLAAGIGPAEAHVQLGVLVGDKLVGVLAFKRPLFGELCSAYMMTDLPVRPSVYVRLSKLIAAVALTTEVKAILEQAWCRQITDIYTTAFTKRPNSMKYRGLLEVHDRKENLVNYYGGAGRWNLDGALAWWLATQAERRPVIHEVPACKP